MGIMFLQGRWSWGEEEMSVIFYLLRSQPGRGFIQFLFYFGFSFYFVSES